MKDLKTPCAACPFSRKVEPGALGGSSPLTYIGQAVGPFMLPCHKTCDLDDPDWKKNFEHSTSQCAGAAIYRANTGVDKLLPAELLHLPADTEQVFASHAEFLAHHLLGTLEGAEEFLKTVTPTMLLRMELTRTEVRLIDKEQK